MKKLFPLLLLFFTAFPALHSCGEETIPVSSVELNKTSLVMMEGEEFTLTATVKPADETEKTVSWRTTDESIVSVNNGRLKALKPGNALVTAMAGGKSESCSIRVEQRTVAVTSVELDRKTLEMTEGDEVTLTATVKPDDATDKTVTWSTSDAAVATVTGGKVKALKPGHVTITATAGGKSAQCAVTVQAKVIPVTSVTLDKTTLTLTEGDETTLTATVKPDDATDKTVTWTTSDATVATVTDGKVKALKAGTATITAKAGDKTATCAVTVQAKVIPVTSMWLDKSELELTEGDEAVLTATVMPENATDKTVTWTSSNTSVATVTNGKVNAVKAGTATITAKAGDKSAKCTVTVLPSFIAVTSVTLDKTTLGLVEGDQAVLTATVSPDNATEPAVTWTASNASVATVEDGMVTAVKAGTAVITAKAGDKSAKCTVTVTAAFVPVTSVTLNKTTLEMTEGDEATLTATVKPDNATDKTVTTGQRHRQDGHLDLVGCDRRHRHGRQGEGAEGRERHHHGHGGREVGHVRHRCQGESHPRDFHHPGQDHAQPGRGRRRHAHRYRQTGQRHGQDRYLDLLGSVRCHGGGRQGACRQGRHRRHHREGGRQDGHVHRHRRDEGHPRDLDLVG